MSADRIAIRSRARNHWGAKRRTELTLAASFDVYALLAEIARLERRLTAMQSERAAAGDGTAARAGAGQLAGAEARRLWGRRMRRRGAIRAVVEARADEAKGAA